MHVTCFGSQSHSVLEFADHVTKRNEGSGNENADWPNKSHAQFEVDRYFELNCGGKVRIFLSIVDVFFADAFL